MCGIIAVLRRRSDRKPPEPDALRALLGGAADQLGAADDADFAATALAVAGRLEEVGSALRGTPGVRALLTNPTLGPDLEGLAAAIAGVLDNWESELDTDAAESRDVETVNAAVVRLKDALWALRRDRLPTALAVGALAGHDPSRSEIEAFTSVQAALSAIDRLEVRGRDSAGLTLLVRGHGLDLAEPGVAALVAERSRDPLFTDGAPAGHPGR